MLAKLWRLASDIEEADTGFVRLVRLGYHRCHVVRVCSADGAPAPTARIKDIVIYQPGGWAGKSGLDTFAGLREITDTLRKNRLQPRYFRSIEGVSYCACVSALKFFRPDHGFEAPVKPCSMLHYLCLGGFLFVFQTINPIYRWLIPRGCIENTQPFAM